MVKIKKQKKIVDTLIAQLPRSIRNHVYDSGIEHVGSVLSHPFAHVVALESLLLSGTFTVREIVESIIGLEKQYHGFCAVGDFESALFCVTKPHRARYLHRLIKLHGVERLYPTIGSVWISAEYVNDEHDVWDDIWSKVIDGTGDRLNVIQFEDRDVFDALPEKLTIYRGYRNEGGECGWSWTLDRKVAEWFARRRSGDHMMATITITKKVALGYFAERNEAEIVVHPKDIDFNQVIIEKLASGVEVA